MTAAASVHGGPVPALVPDPTLDSQADDALPLPDPSGRARRLAIHAAAIKPAPIANTIQVIVALELEDVVVLGLGDLEAVEDDREWPDAAASCCTAVTAACARPC